MAAAKGNGAFAVEFALLMVVALSIYILPSCLAFARRHPNRWVILVLNIAFGGTGLGWLGTFIWALNLGHLAPDCDDQVEDGFRATLLAGGLNDARPLARPATINRRRTTGDAPLSTAAAVAELDCLNSLKAEGHLSEVEFATLKKNLFIRPERKPS